MQCFTAETRIFQRPTQPSEVWLTEKIEFFNGDPANFDSFHLETTTLAASNPTIQSLAEKNAVFHC